MVFVSLPRRTLSVSLSPGLLLPISSMNWAVVLMGVLPTAATTSPASKPALAAGLSAVTSGMRTPPLTFSLRTPR